MGRVDKANEETNHNSLLCGRTLVDERFSRFGGSDAALTAFVAATCDITNGELSKNISFVHFATSVSAPRADHPAVFPPPLTRLRIHGTASHSVSFVTSMRRLIKSRNMFVSSLARDDICATFVDPRA